MGLFDIIGRPGCFAFTFYRFFEDSRSTCCSKVSEDMKKHYHIIRLPVSQQCNKNP